MSILELFCSVDDFWQHFAPNWQGALLAAGQRQRLRPTQMHPSEMMTIIILFHQSHYRTFKAYYTEYVQRHLHSEFPTLVSYQRFASVDAHAAGAPGGLSAHPIGPLYGHQLHRLHFTCGLPQPTHSPAPGVGFPSRARQNLSRLVLRLQTALGRQ